ncbi:MAG: hypothetical protein U1F36_13370 [Planctomycetota bacterium]
MPRDPLSLLGLALGFASCACAQSVPRFHGYQVEDTGLDASNYSAGGLHAFNARGSFWGRDLAQMRDYVRFSNGTLHYPPLGYNILDLDDLDRLCGDRNIQPLPGLTIARGWVRDLTYMDVAPFGSMRLSETSNSMLSLAETGRMLSGQYYEFTAAGAVSLPPDTLPISSVTGSTSLLQLTGLPASTSSAAPFNGSINRHGRTLLRVVHSDPQVPTPYFRCDTNGVCVPVVIPSSLSPNPSYLDDNDLVVCAGFDPISASFRTCLLSSSGQITWLPALGYPNVHNDQIAVEPPSSQWYTLFRSNGARVRIEAAVADFHGYLLTPGTSPKINDGGDVLVRGTDPQGAPRWLILHPDPLPRVLVEFPEGVLQRSARFNVWRAQDGSVPVHIVGGQPGQPTGLFVVLGGTPIYLEGTLGLFDSRQAHDFRIPVPAFLAGVDVDFTAFALDSQFGFLPGQTASVTFR